MFNEVCVSFVVKKLSVNYGVVDVHRVTADVVKVAVAICVR